MTTPEKKRSDGVLYSEKSDHCLGARVCTEKPSIGQLGLKRLVCTLGDILCKTEILM